MILSRAKTTDPLCERCLKLQKVVPAAVALEFTDDEHSGELPLLYSRGLVSLCAQCAQLVEQDGEIRGCNQFGDPLDPQHSWYRES
jgi:hypothetical protein